MSSKQIPEVEYIIQRRIFLLRKISKHPIEKKNIETRKNEKKACLKILDGKRCGYISYIY